MTNHRPKRETFLLLLPLTYPPLLLQLLNNLLLPLQLRRIVTIITTITITIIITDLVQMKEEGVGVEGEGVEEDEGSAEED